MSVKSIPSASCRTTRSANAISERIELRREKQPPVCVLAVVVTLMAPVGAEVVCCFVLFIHRVPTRRTNVFFSSFSVFFLL